MVLIGLVGACSWLLRIHPSLASLVAGVLGLAFLRTCEKIDRARASGASVGVMRTIGIAIASGILGLALIVAGLMPMIVLLPVVVPMGNHQVPDEADMVRAIVIAVVFATPIVVLLRRNLW